MKQLFQLLFGLGLAFATDPAQARTNTEKAVPGLATVTLVTTNYLGLATNGPAMVELYSVTTTSVITNRTLPPRLATNPAAMRVFPSQFTYTNAVFHAFVPGSVHYAIWTNFVALTNGRDMSIWSVRTRPDGWPKRRPVARWSTNSLVWGMKGLTGLSPSWQGEGYPGQSPFTALTRRHAYTRGHGMGPDGFNTQLAGQKVWFLTRDNRIVEAVIKRQVIRVSPGTNGVHRDYTIALLDRDLPDTIEPLRVATLAEFQSLYRFAQKVTWPQPIFQTEQAGHVSTGVSPLIVNTWKPGDSGSPNLIPMPGELIFFGGRSTTGPSHEMQEDMDELCRLEGLSPKKYQMHQANLSKYPDY